MQNQSKRFQGLISNQKCGISRCCDVTSSIIRARLFWFIDEERPCGCLYERCAKPWPLWASSACRNMKHCIILRSTGEHFILLMNFWSTEVDESCRLWVEVQRCFATPRDFEGTEILCWKSWLHISELVSLICKTRQDETTQFTVIGDSILLWAGV